MIECTLQWLAAVLAGRVRTSVAPFQPHEQAQVLSDVKALLTDRRPGCLHCEGWGCRRCEVRP